MMVLSRGIRDTWTDSTAFERVLTIITLPLIIIVLTVWLIMMVVAWPLVFMLRLADRIDR